MKPSLISIMSPAYCTFRNNSSEMLIHLFWSCPVTSPFGNAWLIGFKTLPIIGKYNWMNFITLALRPEPHSTEYSLQKKNHCLLLGRFHIWRAKMDLQTFFSFLFSLLFTYYQVISGCNWELIWHAITSVLANCAPRNCKQF